MLQLQHLLNWKHRHRSRGDRRIDPPVLNPGHSGDNPLTLLAKLRAKTTLHGRSLTTTNELPTQLEYNTIICRFKTLLA